MVADLMVEARRRIAPDIIRIYEDDAQDAAAKVAAWANDAFAEARAAASKIIAHQAGRAIRFMREIRKAKAIERHHLRSAAATSCRESCSTRARVHHHRIVGVEAIIAGLTADRVKVR